MSGVLKLAEELNPVTPLSSGSFWLSPRKELRQNCKTDSTLVEGRACELKVRNSPRLG